MPVKSLHHVAFTVTDLDKTQQFVDDFGLLTAAKSDTHLVARTGGGDAWCYRAELGDERGFIGLGFLVDDVSDLENAIANHGATEIRTLDTPGGGSAVTLTSPEGIKVDLVHGIEGETPVEVQLELRLNTPASRTRYHEPQTTRELGPTDLYRLGHLGLYTNDYRGSVEWFKETLGMVVSDELHIPGNENVVVVGFMRIDRGEEFVDHHSIFFAQDERIGLHHISLEAQDYEAQFRAHRWLLSRGHELNWGIGRHPLGSHVFDVWFDPDKFRFETFTDTDLLNNEHVAGLHDISKGDLDAWSDKAPDSYFA